MTSEEIFYESPLPYLHIPGYGGEGIVSKETQSYLQLRIVKTVAKFYNLHFSEVFMQTKKRTIVLARQVCMYLFVKLVKNIFLKSIGHYFGGMHHSSVIHACATVRGLIKKNNRMKFDLPVIESNL